MKPYLELTLAWLEYLTRRLNGARSLGEVQQRFLHAQDELRGLRENGLLDEPDLAQASADCLAAYQAAEQRLNLLSLVQTFSGEADPVECTHIHQRNGTGVFYNSMQALQCLKCQGWQTIRKVIR